jgi:hypothetical protein
MASWPAFLHLLPAPRPVRGAISLAGLSADQDNIRRAFKKIRFHMIANIQVLFDSFIHIRIYGPRDALIARGPHRNLICQQPVPQR